MIFSFCVFVYTCFFTMYTITLQARCRELRALLRNARAPPQHARCFVCHHNTYNQVYRGCTNLSCQTNAEYFWMARRYEELQERAPEYAGELFRLEIFEEPRRAD